jgi:hypothetical protein
MILKRDRVSRFFCRLRKTKALVGTNFYVLRLPQVVNVICSDYFRCMINLKFIGLFSFHFPLVNQYDSSPVRSAISIRILVMAWLKEWLVVSLSSVQARVGKASAPLRPHGPLGQRAALLALLTNVNWTSECRTLTLFHESVTA